MTRPSSDTPPLPNLRPTISLNYEADPSKRIPSSPDLLESLLKSSGDYAKIACASQPQDIHVTLQDVTHIYRKLSWYCTAGVYENCRDYSYCPVLCDDQRVRLLTIRHVLPPQPLPPFCLQLNRWGLGGAKPEDRSTYTPLGRVVHIVLDWKQATQLLDSAVKVHPVPLLDIVRHDSPWKYPTDTQITNLIVRIAKDMDSLSTMTFFMLSLESVFILNPDQSGKGRPLEYKLCPFSLCMNNEKEKPASHTREELMMRSMAIFCLQMATRLEDLMVPFLQKRVILAVTRHPGLMSMYTELWKESRPSLELISPTNIKKMSLLLGPLVEQFSMEHGGSLIFDSVADVPLLSTTKPRNASLRAASRSLYVLSTIGIKQSYGGGDDISALIQLIQCVDSIHWHGPAVEICWQLLCSSTKSTLGPMIGVLAACIGNIIPGGTASLTTPASSEKSAPWILRMNIIDKVLFEIERAGDYTLLRATQQKLLEAGIGSQLGRSLAGYDQRFSFKVLMPVVRVSTLASFQFPTLQTRLIFENNVQKMSRMAIEACTEPRKDIHPEDMSRFVATMMIMGDFWTWTSKDTNPKLYEIWNTLDDDIFLLYVLPSWSNTTSDATTAAVVFKLEKSFATVANNYILAKNAGGHNTDLLCKKLMYILEWLVHFSWNAPEQVLVNSFSSLYTSYFIGLIFRKMRPFVLGNAAPTRKNPYLFTDDEESESVLSASLYRTRHKWVVEGFETTNPSLPSTCGSKVQSPLGITYCENEDLFAVSDELPTGTMPLDTPIVESLDFQLPEEREYGLREVVLGKLNIPPEKLRLLDIQFVEWLEQSYALNLSVADLEYRFNPSNPESLPWLMKIYKLPLNRYTIACFVRTHKDTSIMAHFRPRPNRHGAPSSTEEMLFLELPLNRDDVEYHTKCSDEGFVPPPVGSDAVDIHMGTNQPRFNALKTLMRAEVIARRTLKHQQQVTGGTGDPPLEPYEGFKPVTLVARTMICHTKRAAPPGTTGMFELRVVDAGDTNDITVGLTWNLTSENNLTISSLKPGLTRTSFGLVISTGCVYYMSPEGVQIKLPYTLPVGTGSRICISIAYRFIYLVVDGIFYPPLPDPERTEGGYFMIPENVEIHGVVRFGCGGIKVTTRCMTNRWTLDKNGDGVLRDSKHNPLAYALYLAELKTKVCPHYHAQRRGANARPKLLGVIADSAIYNSLTPEHQALIDRIHIANETCAAENCTCPAYVQRCIQKVVDESSRPPTNTATASATHIAANQSSGESTPVTRPPPFDELMY